MKRLVKGLMITFVVLTIVCNLPPLRYLLDYAIDDKHYRYSNASGTFTVTDRSGNNVSGIKDAFSKVVQEKNFQSQDTVLYRLFWRNPLTFWRYYSYASEKYDLPYKSWHSIETYRRKHGGVDSDYQSF